MSFERRPDHGAMGWLSDAGLQQAMETTSLALAATTHEAAPLAIILGKELTRLRPCRAANILGTHHDQEHLQHAMCSGNCAAYHQQQPHHMMHITSSTCLCAADGSLLAHMRWDVHSRQRHAVVAMPGTQEHSWRHCLMVRDDSLLLSWSKPRRASTQAA
jgi:hypothetical protein